MEQAIITLLQGDLSTISLLLLFILCLLTKRFVPWWTYEEVVEELKKYEEDAPKLMDAVRDLTDEIRGQGYKSRNVDEVEKQTETIRTRRRRRNSEARRTRDGLFDSTRRRDELDE